MRRADVFREVFFEQADFIAQNVIAAIQNALNGGIDLRGDGLVLRLQVHERNFRCSRHFFTPSPKYTTGRRMLHQPVIGFIFVYPCWRGGYTLVTGTSQWRYPSRIVL